MRFREIVLESGTRLLLGKDAENNDELLKKFEGEENTILHTVSPGSPFCVMDNLKPSRKDISKSGATKLKVWKMANGKLENQKLKQLKKRG